LLGIKKNPLALCSGRDAASHKAPFQQTRATVVGHLGTTRGYPALNITAAPAKVQHSHKVEHKSLKV